MTYQQQLAWLARRFNLNENQTFSLDMQLHLMALQTNLFVFQVAAQIIEAVRKQDASKPVEAIGWDERSTKYLDKATTITVDITQTDGWDLHAVEQLVARHLYDFAQEIREEQSKP